MSEVLDLHFACIEIKASTSHTIANGFDGSSSILNRWRTTFQ